MVKQIEIIRTLLWFLERSDADWPTDPWSLDHAIEDADDAIREAGLEPRTFMDGPCD